MADCADPLVFRYCAVPAPTHPVPDSVPHVFAAVTAHEASATAEDATVVCPALDTVNGVDGAANVAVA